MKSSLAALKEAHSRCGNDPAYRMDDESQWTIKFVYGLSNSYSEFKGFYENNLLDFPDSLDSAFTEASTYRVNRPDNRVQRADVFLTNGRAGRGNKGRGRSSPNTNVIKKKSRYSIFVVPLFSRLGNISIFCVSGVFSPSICRHRKSQPGKFSGIVFIEVGSLLKVI